MHLKDSRTAMGLRVSCSSRCPCHSELHRSYAPRQIWYLCQNRAPGQGSAMYWN